MQAASDDLYERWRRAWALLRIPYDAGRTERDAAFSDLLCRYAEPHRHYHTIGHITHGLHELGAYERVMDWDGVSTGEYPTPAGYLELAWWYHDAIWVPGTPDDVERSAQLARESLSRAGLDEVWIQHVESLIRWTRHERIPDRDSLQGVIVDVDLSIFGQPVSIFNAYEQHVREEYVEVAGVPDAAFRSKRAGILQGFLDRQRIYTVHFFAEQYEYQARENLQRSILSLTKEVRHV